MYLKLEKVLASVLKVAAILLFMLPAPGLAGLSPSLQKMVVGPLTGKPDSLIKVVIFLEDDQLKEDVSRTARRPMLKRDLRIKSVVSKLKSFRSPGMDRVQCFLTDHSSSSIKRHWIVPAFTVAIPLSKLSTLAALEGVKLVVENALLTYEKPVSIADAPVLSASVSDQLALLNVPDLWSRGLKGKGRLVCSFDTGVEQSHPALASKWRGNHVLLSAAWFSNLAPDTLPSDRTGHGTHTMGIMVGASAADTFGVAPEAEWITAGVIDQGRPLGATISDILDAFEWALDPDGDPNTTNDVPDVILNSWGIPKGLFAPCDETFHAVTDNVEAAGIVTIFAAGNEGPDPSTLRNPADRASTPINSFAVGAVDNNRVIAGFSSRGPSSCDPTEIKPEVVAPGVSVRSSHKGGGYTSMTGTSMAAPYIAGLVALMRQYNPDASVEQIKNALLQACTDLGDSGEDNAYGNGLPDAARLLDYLPAPAEPQFSIERLMISDDGVAAPGEEFGLQLLLRSTLAGIETVVAAIVPDNNDSVIAVNEETTFFFGQGGTTAINSEPFTMRMRFDSAFYHGREISCLLFLESPGGVNLDTLDFTITVGIAPNGEIASHSTQELDISISDFGQYGFAPGSIYNLQGEGFRYNGSPNLLYEAGIIVGRNSLQLSSAVRDSMGLVVQSDFIPSEPLSAGWMEADDGFHRRACFVDSQSEIPIPVTVTQQTTSFPYGDDNGFLIVKYYLRNDSIEKLIGLYFGFLADFDLIGNGEYCSYDEAMGLLYQESDTGPVVGLVALENVTSFKAIDNGSTKTGFTREELFDLISSGSDDINDTLVGDMLLLVNAGPFLIYPGDSVEVALALVGGHDVASFYANAVAAKDRFDLCTDVDAEEEILPQSFALHQNYPNPFNPTTTIAFSLAQAGEVSLEVFNTLGQKVKTLFAGRFPKGRHTVEWDATNRRGDKVAGGVYFYRLASAKQSQTRKMVLLK
jgi:hypothetical protein